MEPSFAPSPAAQLCRHINTELDTINREWGRCAHGDLMACEIFAVPAEKATYRNGIMQGISKTLDATDRLLSTVQARGGDVARFTAVQRDSVADALKRVLDSCERFNNLRVAPSPGFTSGLAQAELYGTTRLNCSEGWEVLAGVDAARERAAFTYDLTQVEASCENNKLLMHKLLLLQSVLARSWRES
jgi:hypothetical protein